MPHERLKRHLEESARKRGIEPGTDRYNAYVYGTIARLESEGKIGDGNSHDDRETRE